MTSASAAVGGRNCCSMFMPFPHHLRVDKVIWVQPTTRRSVVTTLPEAAGPRAADDEERHIRLGEGFHEAPVPAVRVQLLRHGRQYGTAPSAATVSLGRGF